MKIIKKYWTHIVSIGFLISFLAFSILYSHTLHNPEFDNMENNNLFIPIVISVFIFVILVWVEIIASMIKISKNKGPTLHYIYAYLFNVFYIPCYYTRYVNKDKKYYTKNLIFIIISVGLIAAITALIVI